MMPHHLFNPPHLLLRVGPGAVHFTEQYRCGIHRVATVGKVLRGANREVVHHFQPGRDDTIGDHAAHRGAGSFDIVECRQQQARVGGLRQQFHRNFHNHTEQTFRTCHHRHQVVARAVRRVGPQGMAFPIDGDHLQLEDVVHCQTVLQAMHPAGIFGHIAADRARDLGAGIRRVVEPMGCRRLGDRQVTDAGLHPGDASPFIEFEYPVEFRHDQQHAICQWQCPAGQAGTRAARHHRNAVIAANSKDAGHLLDRFRQYHQHGALAVRAESVTLVRFELHRFREDAGCGQHAAQLPQQRRRCILWWAIRTVHEGSACIARFTGL